MPGSTPSEHEALRAAFGPGKDCPPIEKLGLLTEGSAPAEISLAQHVESCTYCQTELHLLRTFQAQPMLDNEDVRQVVQRLQAKPLPGTTIAVRERPRFTGANEPWWRAVLNSPRLVSASFAMAALLLVVAAGVIYFRHSGRPVLEATNRGNQEVFRSPGFAVLSPAGDIQETPHEIRWEPVPQAAKYQVRLLEVDRSEVWKAETSQDRIELPSATRGRIIPAKTLFCEVSAFNASGSKIGETGLVRFRLLQKAGNH